MMEKFPKKVADFGNAFVDLQIKRHDADYNPERTFYRSAVTEDIDLAEVAINDLDAVDLADRKAFAAFVLLNRRK